MAAPSVIQAILLFSILTTSLNIIISLCKEELNRTCNEQERDALITFKQGLIDPSNRLSSWSRDEVDCCKWHGVRCSRISGQVVELNLSNPPSSTYMDLRGEISPSLMELKFLALLDLSYNYFALVEIPSFLGSMKSLTHLDLSFSAMTGLVPHQLGNLSNLQHLDLGYNFGFRVDNLNWMASFPSLEYLDLSGVNLQNQDWLHVVGMLPSLSELHLVSCQISNKISPKWQANFTSLEVFDLSNNNLNQQISPWISNLSVSLRELELGNNFLQGELPPSMSSLQNLMRLDLQNNQLTGRIPDTLGTLKLLQVLDLSNNTFSGLIPSSFANLTSLRKLNLGHNQLNGTIPKSLGLLNDLQGLYLGYNALTGTVPKTLGTLSNLVTLDLGFNSLGGQVDELNFLNLSKLKELCLSSTSLFLSVNSSWIPPFQLSYLLMSSFRVGVNFPAWLPTQISLKVLEMSHSGITEQPPSWFWKWTLQLDFLDLSNNQICGDLTNILLNSTIIILSSNRFKGQLPRVSANVEVLSIANNSISGPITPFFCERVTMTNKLAVLDLSNNILSGELGHCWKHWKSLMHLNLGNNNLSGKIPNSIGYLYVLDSLQLQKNGFSGYIPSGLQNCSALRFVDIGGNQLSGTIPIWMWEMQILMVLRLRSNQLKGKITLKLCELSSLIVLDLANNSLSGTIPNCLNYMQAMSGEDEIVSNPLQYSYGNDLNYQSYKESLILVPKGNELEYRENLILVRMIDLSSNMLYGPIPSEISSLSALRFLNLSRNHISGEIPNGMGRMKLLESLDLSSNQISGEIPQSLSDLFFLSFLNLSYNNLSGRIPTSTQLQSLDAISYTGNSQLCGPPLTKNCRIEDASQRGEADDENVIETSALYMGMGVGFAAGFWVVCSVLFLNRSCRHAYFRFVEYLNDQLYVAIVLKGKSFLGKLKSRLLG